MSEKVFSSASDLKGTAYPQYCLNPHGLPLLIKGRFRLRFWNPIFWSAMNVLKLKLRGRI